MGETACRSKREAVSDFLREFVQRQLSDLNISVILHGSYATGTITAFSDIDLLAFIPSNRDGNYSCLIDHRLRRLTFQLHRIDPLMHHNVDVVDERNFENYDESTLPIDAISQSVILLGSPTLSISPNLQLSKANAAAKLVKTCNSIILFQDTVVNRTPYRIKCLISALFLVPILLLQSHKGMFLYKRESLALAEKFYGNVIDFRAIYLATKMRSEWHLSRSSVVVRKTLIPFESCLYSPLWLQRISGSLFPVKKSVYQELLRESKRFVGDVLLYAKQNDIT